MDLQLWHHTWALTIDVRQLFNWLPVKCLDRPNDGTFGRITDVRGDPWYC